MVYPFHRIVLGICIAFFVVLFVFWVFLERTVPLGLSFTRPVSVASGDHFCNLPADVLVVVQTTARAVYETLPVQLLASPQCDRNILIFSDLAQKLGPYRVHDVLAEVSEEVRSNSSAFDYYRKLQEYQATGQDIRTFLNDSSEAERNLERYKSIPMLKKAWSMRPGYDWYMFIGADTYLFQKNLALWLERLNPSKPWYLGSPVYSGNETAAHSGSGIILSRAAMSKGLDSDPDIVMGYYELAQQGYSGDYLIMKALQQEGIPIHNAWPMLQYETKNTMHFGPRPDSRRPHWCQPLVTIRATPEDVDSIRQFERHWQHKDTTNPILLSDAFDAFISMHLTSEQDDWDNLSSDLIFRDSGLQSENHIPEGKMTTAQKVAYSSFEKCRIACEQHERCLQFVHYAQTCGISFSYRLGTKRDPADGVRYKSGWDLARIGYSQDDMPCISTAWM
ncbi:hypothetical protein PHISCL_03836 [Aspergillus sclerotialis]|uniref:Glycosyltransferase family 31 protein n=1 Tax=Aspergillus sclerotialis TaxID=2070753 RepID=A0A3A3A0Z9_9EURO|nr:hypothetical protein PHISCL_03836 [Aspergillus sclerotialis]